MKYQGKVTSVPLHVVNEHVIMLTMKRRKFHLVKGRKQEKGGTVYDFWVLRESVYVKSVGAMKPVYITYVGVEKVLSESKARNICDTKCIEYDDLEAVNGLEIITDDEFERRKLARREAQREARALAKASSTT